MNIYSAVRSADRSFEIAPGARAHDLPLEARGLIGDGITAALVRVDGAVDWLCMPRFDSPSVFGALLDPDGGGEATIRPVARPFRGFQRYDPDTNVLETLFEVPGQAMFRLIDYMPWTDDARASIHEIHRRIECLEGAADLELIFDPRFDYGRDQPRFTVDDNGILATSGRGERMVCALGATVAWHERTGGGRGLESRLRMSAGDRAWMILSWDAPHPEPISFYRPYEHLRQTRRFWRKWSHRLRYDGPWRDHVLRSALLLKLLLYAPTGAMVAAPTTSLPEWLGGVRNWDYRFAWIRDAALGIRSTNLIGYEYEARDFFHFVREVLSTGSPLAIMYTVDGAPVPAEEILAHLSGFRDSAPVRIGNAARDQLQLDIPGYLLDAAFLHERTEGTITLRMWRVLTAIVEQCADLWTQPDHGIWEPRSGVQHNVHSKLMSWVCFDRAARIAPHFGDNASGARWSRLADTVQSEVLDKGLDPTGKHFVSTYGGSDLDAALLLLSPYGFVKAGDPRMLRTIDEITSRLSDNGYLHRYHYGDGIAGGEGAFVLCGFWLAEALAIEGRIAEAQDVFLRHVEASNHLGLLAEEVDPSNGQLLGNFPQAFSHMGLISAAARIDLALRLRDERSPKTPRFALDA